MGNVWGAMKKHEAERVAEAAGAADAASAPPPDGTAAPVEPAPPRQEEMPPARTLSQAMARAAAEAPAIVPAASQAPPSAAGPDSRVPHPADGSSGYSQLIVAHHDRGGAIAEEYRSLRTNLLAQCSDQRFCYMVTSADVGEGKTVTCLNLAVVMAERQDRRTILVDFDLRRRTMAGMLNARQAPGLIDLLRGSCRLADVVQPTVYPNLFFIPSGHAHGNELGELVIRPELEEMVMELRRNYDYAIIDTPPMNVVSETGVIGKSVGEALLVVRMNKTHRESIEKAVRLLHAANVKIAGLVLTHRKYHIPDYLYKYS